MAISKLIFNGQTQIDVSRDTVAANNLLQGFTAKGADGNPVSGGIVSQGAQIIHPSLSDQVISSGKYLSGNQTIEGVLLTNLLASNILNGVTVKVGSASDDDCVASVTGTASGGSATLIQKTITSNGIYNAVDDNADGYSQVTVNVSGGGASNIVQGIFTTTLSEGVEQTVNIPYTGNGYPIFCTVEVTGGVYNSDITDWYSVIHRYAVGWFCMTKRIQSSAPTYNSFSTDDQGVTTGMYKNSTSISTNYARGGAQNASSFYVVTGETVSQCVVFKSKNEMLVRTSSTSYGLLAGINYSYTIIYSE